MPGRTEQKLDRGGVIAALAAFGFWGFVPIYYKGLQDVGAWEVLAHRVIWSVPILVLFLAVRDRREFWNKLRLPLTSIAWLVVSGLTISINWLVFVWAVANDHVLDTSLGYFGTPLVNVLLGYLFLKERLPVLQVFAVVMAAAGTIYLGWYLGQAALDRYSGGGILWFLWPVEKTSGCGADVGFTVGNFVNVPASPWLPDMVVIAFEPTVPATLHRY